MEDKAGLYARALQAFKVKFMPIYEGKVFTSDDVYRYFQLDRRTDGVNYKHAMGEVLYNLSRINKKPVLEQSGKKYRIINRDLNVIEWWRAKRGDTVKVKFPRGVEDHTSFGFDDSIILYPKDLIVIAGEGNTAKTAFCLNMVVENVDNHDIYYFTSEFNDVKFADRMDKFDWVNVYKEDGTPKFTLVEQTENWQDKIQPNGFNIVDWVYLDDEMWKIRTIMKNIIGVLNRGIAIVVIQKRSYKQVGEGGKARRI